jgi:hypothetical protein
LIPEHEVPGIPNDSTLLFDVFFGFVKVDPSDVVQGQSSKWNNKDYRNRVFGERRELLTGFFYNNDIASVPDKRNHQPLRNDNSIQDFFLDQMAFFFFLYFGGEDVLRRTFLIELTLYRIAKQEALLIGKKRDYIDRDVPDTKALSRFRFNLLKINGFDSLYRSTYVKTIHNLGSLRHYGAKKDDPGEQRSVQDEFNRIYTMPETDEKTEVDTRTFFPPGYTITVKKFIHISVDIYINTKLYPLVRAFETTESMFYDVPTAIEAAERLDELKPFIQYHIIAKMIAEKIQERSKRWKDTEQAASQSQ